MTRAAVSLSGNIANDDPHRPSGGAEIVQIPANLASDAKQYASPGWKAPPAAEISPYAGSFRSIRARSSAALCSATWVRQNFRPLLGIPELLFQLPVSSHD
jgi:hypothetical protein